MSEVDSRLDIKRKKEVDKKPDRYPGNKSY